MGKKINQQEVKSTDQVVVNINNQTILYDGKILTFDSVKAFFGLAILGKMIRFGITDRGVVAVERIPEGIESIVTELKRILEKYKDKPMDGFKEIERTVNFAERLGIADQ